ncbi:hypothetical protein BA188_07225 [Aeromonas hydrophila]|nr:hypothetical protein OI72_02715 [Aeromonas hydrophila]OFC43501.1 hypothetical protein BA189_03770 [Aeromonas hydrophila]OFC54585.1 hypothetical protein BA188_07225 [Aeromonas hydrophila]
MPKFRRIVKICRISPKFIDPRAQQDKFCRLFFEYDGQATGKQERQEHEQVRLFAASSRPQTGGEDQWRA